MKSRFLVVLVTMFLIAVGLLLARAALVSADPPQVFVDDFARQEFVNGRALQDQDSAEPLADDVRSDDDGVGTVQEQPAAVPTQVQIKKAEVRFTEIYRLKNQNAARIAEELKKMIPELEIILDPGNESVIIQEMTPKMREFVTEVIQRLSAACQEPLAPPTRFYPLVGAMTPPRVASPPSPTEAQKRYREAEEQARGHGLGLRSKVPPGQRTPDELQSLKNTVTTAFDARQELLRQELNDFRNRLDRLAKTLEARERDKNAIIQHRVDELLNPNLNWDAVGNPRGAGMMGSAAGGSTERPRTSSGVGSNSDSGLSGTLSAPTSAVGMGMRVTIPQTAPRASDFRVGDSAFGIGTIDKGLDILSQYPRFSNLALDMTEQQFRAFLEQQKLAPQLSIPRDGQLNYSVPLGDGNRLTVMFGLDGKCRGIEPISGSAPSPILPQPASADPVRVEKVVTKIFRLEQSDAASVAKTLQGLASEKPFSARISADVTSNSVIVFANPDDMHVIEAVIIRLDKAPESATPATSGTSNTAKPTSTQLASELKSWQGRWLLVSAEINGKEQKRDEFSTQSITVSGSALKIAVRNSETKGFFLVDGALKLGSLPGGTKAFTFQTPSGQITRQEVETVDGVTRAKDISYEVPSPLLGIYEFREGKLVLCFHELGSKDTPKHPDKFQTTPDSDLHLYIFDKVAEPDAAAPAEAEALPKQNVPAGADNIERTNG